MMQLKLNLIKKNYSFYIFMCNVNRNTFFFLEKKVMPPIEVVDTCEKGTCLKAPTSWRRLLQRRQWLCICWFALLDLSVFCVFVDFKMGVVPMHARYIISHRTHVFYVYTCHVRIRKSTSDCLTWIGRCYHSQRITDPNGNPSASQ